MLPLATLPRRFVYFNGINAIGHGIKPLFWVAVVAAGDDYGPVT